MKEGAPRRQWMYGVHYYRLPAPQLWGRKDPDRPRQVTRQMWIVGKRPGVRSHVRGTRPQRGMEARLAPVSRCVTGRLLPCLRPPKGLLGCDTRRLVVLLEHLRYLAATRWARIGSIYNGGRGAASVSEPCGHRPSIPYPPSTPALCRSSLQSVPKVNPCRSFSNPCLKPGS